MAHPKKGKAKGTHFDIYCSGLSDKLEGITGERTPGEYIFHDKILLEKITGKGVLLFHDKILFRKNYRRK